METLFGSLGVVVTLYVALRLEIKDVRREVADLRFEVRSEITDAERNLRTELGGKIDRLGEMLLQHVQQGHPPHQAA